MTSTEERQIVYGWNDTRSEVRRDATLVDLFEEQAGRTPEAVGGALRRARCSASPSCATGPGSSPGGWCARGSGRR